MKTQLTEDQEAAIGRQLASVLRLRRDSRNKEHWGTDWGSKTNLGIYRMVKRIMAGDGNEPS